MIASCFIAGMKCFELLVNTSGLFYYKNAMNQMISSISYFIYKQFNYPVVPHITEDDYNWQQRRVIQMMNKRNKKAKRKQNKQRMY